MNIEEILPELFGEKRVYYCQRCLNHGLEVKRKNHKLECNYRFCTCNDCQMVDKRRELNSRLLRIESISPPPPPPPPLPLPPPPPPPPQPPQPPQVPLPLPSSSSLLSTSSLSSSSLSQPSLTSNVLTPAVPLLPDMNIFSSTPEQAISPPAVKGKERRPNCQRCAQHSVLARLKGHKRCCPFRDCPCAKCQVVQERQKLMADQIKLRRRQKKQKNLDLLSESNSMRNYKSFAQQQGSLFNGCLKCAQQTLAYQQILTLIDPVATLQPSTFSAILAACPHNNNDVDNDNSCNNSNNNNDNNNDNNN